MYSFLLFFQKIVLYLVCVDMYMLVQVFYSGCTHTHTLHCFSTFFSEISCFATDIRTRSRASTSRRGTGVYMKMCVCVCTPLSQALHARSSSSSDSSSTRLRIQVKGSEYKVHTASVLSSTHMRAFARTRQRVVLHCVRTLSGKEGKMNSVFRIGFTMGLSWTLSLVVIL